MSFGCRLFPLSSSSSITKVESYNHFRIGFFSNSQACFSAAYSRCETPKFEHLVSLLFLVYAVYPSETFMILAALILYRLLNRLISFSEQLNFKLFRLCSTFPYFTSSVLLFLNLLETIEYRMFWSETHSFLIKLFKVPASYIYLQDDGDITYLLETNTFEVITNNSIYFKADKKLLQFFNFKNNFFIDFVS